MARKKKEEEPASAAWLVTFSDLMTLLLTFFVLLLSMSSMDRVMITQISAVTRSLSMMDRASGGKAPDNIKLVLDLIREPTSLLNKLDRIKDLLFPNDILPPEMSPGTLDENLQVLANPEGLVIVLTDAIVFRPGETSLSAEGKKLLDAVAPFLMYADSDVVISGYSDSRPPPGTDPYATSALRAMSVLEYFLQQKLRPQRFSLSAYGPDRPIDTADTEAARARNRRVEILVKTVRYVGQYP